eukprot:5787452-Ditylum_brightwellii.AAC.2
MYESDTVGQRRNKCKGYQAPFKEFVEATKVCEQDTNKDGSVILKDDSPAIDQLWDTVAPIINQMSNQMKAFLNLFHADDLTLSWFCKHVDNADDLQEQF